jgi:hypothetical protein
MKFTEQAPSKHWAVLKFRGVKFAEVWFKPEGEPFALHFRIPQRSFQLPGISGQLTIENLLKAVGIGAEEVESWHCDDAACSGTTGSRADLAHPLIPPSGEAAHLNLHVRLKPPTPATTPQAAHPVATAPQLTPPQAAAPAASSPADDCEGAWQILEGRWKAILDAEAGLDTLRMSMESLRDEMEAATNKSLTTEEKVNCFNADLARWNKGKSRIVYALPKMREYIHRATWAAGTPERKKIEEIHKAHIEPRVPFPEMEQVGNQLDNLLKDRQVLAAHGALVYQECRTILSEVQTALRNLQTNAAAKLKRKRAESRGGQFFKHIRKWTGVD